MQLTSSPCHWGRDGVSDGLRHVDGRRLAAGSTRSCFPAVGRRLPGVLPAGHCLGRGSGGGGLLRHGRLRVALLRDGGETTAT